ncbi:phosphatase PAP2 family protein [Candidatus Daviesbacteria bacterium]|nr:phosphatase PAP2 family protein [Candidatus Daviesbacteria bacterium]
MDNLGFFFLIFGLNNQNNFLDSLMIFGAEYVIYISFALIFVLAFRGQIKERKALILVCLSIPIVVLMIKFIHLFLFEPRPYIAQDISPLIPDTKEDASFPSRHTALMFTLAFSYFFYQSKWRFHFLIMALWVSLSRIFVGVHYPLDIIGGIMTAFVSVFIAWKIKEKLKRGLGLNQSLQS